MHAETNQAFEAAQASTLSRFGVHAESRYVEVPS